MQPKERIQAWFDQVWNRGNTHYIDQHLAESCRVTGLSPGPITCRQDVHALYTQMMGRFNGLHIVVTDIIEVGTTAAGIAHVTGIHRATGKAIEFDSHFFGQLENDLIGSYAMSGRYSDYFYVWFLTASKKGLGTCRVTSYRGCCIGL